MNEEIGKNILLAIKYLEMFIFNENKTQCYIKPGKGDAVNHSYLNQYFVKLIDPALNKKKNPSS